jgi:photosystem II stability/assembly factor-like uncharacterized protein
MNIKLNIFRLPVLALMLAATLGQGVAQAQMPAAPTPLQAEPARHSASAVLAPMLGVTKAGKRIVAVGDYGIALLSDDDGKQFRQAGKMPVSSTLAAVSFADDKNGWAVGHWGAIVHTSDGGETWTIQRLDTQEDRPLFSVHFFNAEEGVAVGLWSLVLHTRDGGKTWETVQMPVPPDGGKADRNLFGTFVSPKGSLFVAAERGAVLRSDDRGLTWHYLNTGYKGSFWTGLALTDGTLIVAGLRGSLYRSTDDGKSWQAIDSGSKSSLTDLALAGKRIVGVGLDGVEVESSDGGASFTGKQRDDRLSMTALVAAGNGLVRFSRRGVVADSADDKH